MSGDVSQRWPLFPAQALRRMLRRMAFQIHEHHPEVANLLLVGIPTRGVVLARRVAQELERICNRPVPTGILDPRPYRDDRRGAKGEVADASLLPERIDGRDVVLVDDVLMTGRTIRAALDGLIRYGRPRTVRLAVLIDRGLREFPIQPDFVGRVLPTKARERVQVRLEEVDGQEGIWIVESS